MPNIFRLPYAITTSPLLTGLLQILNYILQLKNPIVSAAVKTAILLQMAWYNITDINKTMPALDIESSQ